MRWLAALLLTPVAGLAQVLYMPNQGGGEIVLTARPCVHQGKTYDPLKEAYTWSNEYRKIQGCWYVKDGNVEVIYENGHTRVYRISDFTRRD